MLRSASTALLETLIANVPLPTQMPHPLIILAIVQYEIIQFVLRLSPAVEKSFC
jgi:hypothetical protein